VQPSFPRTCNKHACYYRADDTGAVHYVCRARPSHHLFMHVGDVAGHLLLPSPRPIMRVGRPTGRPTLHVNSTRPLSLSGTCSRTLVQARLGCCTSTAAHPGRVQQQQLNSLHDVRTGHAYLVVLYCQTTLRSTVTKRFYQTVTSPQ